MSSVCLFLVLNYSQHPECVEVDRERFVLFKIILHYIYNIIYIILLHSFSLACPSDA